MNIICLNPPFLTKFSREQRSPAVTKSGTFYYPMWLAYATGVLEQNNFNCRLIDAVASQLNIEQIIKNIELYRPKLMVISTSTPSIYNDINVAEIIKQHLSETKIILVGTHVSALPKETLKLSPLIDAVAVGEYDYIVKDLAKAIKDQKTWAGIPGLVWRQRKEIIFNPGYYLPKNLDALPMVSQIYKSHLNIRNYNYSSCRHPVIALVTSRGCSHHCIFCVYTQTFSKRQVRYRSPNNILEELLFIKKNMPEVKEIMFEDDALTLEKERIKNICQLIIKNKLKITWSANSRADVDLETLKIMKKAGCRLLCVGFESGDTEILKTIKKGLTLSQMIDFMKNAQRVGIIIHGCFIFGHPGEDLETMEKTFKLAKKLNPDSAQMFPVIAYPGTELYQWAEKHKYLATSEYNRWITREGLHNSVISQPNLRAEQLVNCVNYFRRKFYLRPKYVINKLQQVIKHPREFKRNCRAFLTLVKHL